MTKSIPTEKLRAVRTIVVHDNCGDGTGSALLLKDALPQAEVVFVQYGTEAYRNLPATEGMLFCDIAPPAERVEEFLAVGAIVLDHHRTARSVVERFEDGVFADEATEPGVSGTFLAYREVWEPLRGADSTEHVREWVRWFATLTGIRDTWQREDPRWDAACRLSHLLFFMPNVDWLAIPLSKLAVDWADHFDWIGSVLDRKHEKSVQKSIRRAHRLVSPRGTRILVMNSTSHTSDAAESLGSDIDLVAGFSYEAENGTPKVALSLRSHTDFDCAAMARRFGGGGHTRAAGMSLPVTSESPYEALLRAVTEYESEG